jgi:FkbM family methyltransferase
VKRFAKAIIRRLVSRAPFGVREAMLDGCIDRIGISDFCLRLFPKFKIVEVGAEGDRGIVTSAWNDIFVLPEYAATGTFAKTLTAELVNFFGSGGGTYIDIGANIGMTTIPVARNPRVRCLAFEPEPVNFEFLKRNVARNAIGGSVEFHKVALFHSRSSMSLAIADRNIGDHRLTMGTVPGRRMIEIPAVPLDDFVDKVTEPLAVKIDTQGAEPFVVAGGSKVLARAGLLVMEFCPYLMQQLGGDPNTVIELVSSFDRVAVIRDEDTGIPSYIAPTEARTILQHKLRTAEASDSDYVDIIAIRDPRIR